MSGTPGQQHCTVLIHMLCIFSVPHWHHLQAKCKLWSASTAQQQSPSGLSGWRGAGLISAAPGRRNSIMQNSAKQVEGMVRMKMEQREYIILCLEDTNDWSNATTRRLVMQGCCPTTLMLHSHQRIGKWDWNGNAFVKVKITLKTRSHTLIDRTSPLVLTFVHAFTASLFTAQMWNSKLTVFAC